MDVQAYAAWWWRRVLAVNLNPAPQTRWRVALMRFAVQLVVIGFESQPVLDGYLAEHRFKPDRVVSVPVGSVRFQGTPTLALIESDGKIRTIWRGQLTSEREAEVRQSLE